MKRIFEGILSQSKPKRGVSKCVAYMHAHKISHYAFTLISVLLLSAMALDNDNLMHPAHGINLKTVMDLKN
jgi:hypothetical protein